MELTLLFVLIIIIAICIGCNGDFKEMLEILALGFFILVMISLLGNNKEKLTPNNIQDIYRLEEVLSDQKSRNKDAFPEETDGKGPILGPYWAVDNSDVVEDTLSYSRGVYAYDPIKKRQGAFNAEAFDNDDALSRRQEFRSGINKRAVDGMSRNTRNVFDKHFLAELAENDYEPWWGKEEEENDMYAF